MHVGDRRNEIRYRLVFADEEDREVQVWMENLKFCFEDSKLEMPIRHSSGEDK